jgi:hypothetical protein
MPHLRIEVGRWWLQVGRSDPEPPPEHESPPGPIIDHPTPQVPERVGFYRLPDETD